jgi:hypothetical protein
MQDRYTGDVGDFGKLGLLRVLCGQNDFSPLSLGIVWYLVEDESHNKDGKHIGYLFHNPEKFKICDPELYEGLRGLLVSDHGDVVADRRRVKILQSSGLLSSGTSFFPDLLSYRDVIHFKDRPRVRTKWLEGALQATIKAEIVFLDPDNGIECSVSKTAKKGPKYVFWDEIEAFAARKQSVVVYHHLGRSNPSAEQVTSIRRQFKQRLRDFTILDVVFRRGTQRAYFIAAAVDHRDVLTSRLSNMLTTPWNNHFKTFPQV